MRIVLPGEASYQDPLYDQLVSTVRRRKPETKGQLKGNIKYKPFQRTILRLDGRFETVRLDDMCSVLLACFLAALLFINFFLAIVMMKAALLLLISNRN